MDNHNKKTFDCQIANNFSVYVIWCCKTGKYYVGVTCRKPRLRINEHKIRNEQTIDSEIQKIGWENNFDWWVVEKDIPAELISDREKYWVKFFNCVFPKGYNMTGGGIGNTIQSEETRTKKRAISLALGLRPPILRGAEHPNFCKPKSPETREKMSKSRLGMKNPKLALMNRINKPNKGKPKSEEHKAKISLTKTRQGILKKVLQAVIEVLESLNNQDGTFCPFRDVLTDRAEQNSFHKPEPTTSHNN